MARSLPLYPGRQELVLEATPGLFLDKECRRCNLHEKARTVCIGADGAPGGLLVVGEGPGKQEDALGRPWVGVTGAYLRALVGQLWTGPVVYDNALRCCSPEDIKPKHVDACRPYLAQTLIEARPERVLAMGAHAARSVLGRSAPPMSTRRGFAFTAEGVPVFLLLHPTAGLRNRFVRGWFEEDLRWALTTDPETLTPGAAAHLVTNETEARLAVAYLRRGGKVALDVETGGRRYTPAFRIVSAAFCRQGTEHAFVWTREACQPGLARDVLTRFLLDASVPKGGHNVKYDAVSFHAAWGVMPRGLTFDTLLERKLLDPLADGSLASCAEMVGMGGHKQEAEDELEAVKTCVRRVLAQEKRVTKYAHDRALGLKVPKKPPETPDRLVSLGVDALLEADVRNPAVDADTWAYALLPDDVTYRYNARDAVSTSKLEDHLSVELAHVPPIERVWNMVVQRASPAIAQVEAWGIRVDKGALEMFDRFLEVRETEVLQKLKGYDPLLNWGSPQQVGDFFFHRSGLTSRFKTDTGKDSTAEKALESLKDKHPAVGLLLEYRKLTKLRGTYASGMLVHIMGDGRVHTSIWLSGAETGRTSSTSPNLQNIPSEKNDPAEGPYYGRMARDVFVASPGWVLLSFDYSQIELRVAAMLSKDPVMLAVYQSGIDFHTRTAQLVAPLAWGVADWDALAEQDKKRFRSAAKTVNFGLLYGKGDKALAEELGITVALAAQVRAAILGTFKVFAQWLKDRIDEGRKTGLSWTWWAGERARRRSLHRIADQGQDWAASGARSNAENSTANTPIQGTANEFCITSLTEAVDYLRGNGMVSKLVLPIHDALLFDAKPSEVPELVAEVRRIMTSWPSGGVPLVVDVEWGPSWGSLVKYVEPA